MKIFAPLSKIDQETKTVWGYASTEALDSQREIVKREAMIAALPEYMKFANVREMHQPSAVGIVQDAQIDSHGLFITAKVVDQPAWEKVQSGVYKGFSIGGRATARDPANKAIITALDLTEISLVDRPANPEAVFDCYKVEGGDTTDMVPLEDIDAVEKTGARNSAADLEKLQAIHDHVCALGASCGANSDDSGDDKKAATIGADLAKLQSRIAELEAKAAPRKGESSTGEVRGIGKSQDGQAVGQGGADEEETALALIKKAQANPIFIRA